jgi:hypothetical protein
MHEYQVVTAAHTKPHALLALLAELRAGSAAARTIVFASAVDAVRRLTNLLEGAKQTLDLRVFEMSSRVASRVQVETLAALQREPSWSVPLSILQCLSNYLHAHMRLHCAFKLHPALRIQTAPCVFGRFTGSRILGSNVCSDIHAPFFNPACNGAKDMQCCLLPWPALYD